MTCRRCFRPASPDRPGPMERHPRPAPLSMGTCDRKAGFPSLSLYGEDCVGLQTAMPGFRGLPKPVCSQVGHPLMSTMPTWGDDDQFPHSAVTYFTNFGVSVGQPQYARYQRPIMLSGEMTAITAHQPLKPIRRRIFTIGIKANMTTSTMTAYCHGAMKGLYIIELSPC